MTHFGFVPSVDDRIRLIEMPQDPAPIEPGSLGTITYVSPGPRQIGVKWDSGRSLHLLLDIDKFEVVAQHRVVVLEDNGYARYEVLVEATDPDQAAGIAREMIDTGQETPEHNAQHFREDALAYVTDVFDANGEECVVPDEHEWLGVNCPDVLKARADVAEVVRQIDRFDMQCQAVEHTDVGTVWELLHEWRKALHDTLPIEIQHAITADAEASEKPSLEKIVFANLDAAVENGYYAPLESFTPEQLAIELTAFAEDCQDIADHLLVPHVKAWIAARAALCKDEGCEHHGTPHVCNAGAA